MTNLEKTFEAALAALNAGDLKRAEELFRRVVKNDRSNVPALNLLVVVLMSMERFADAEPFIARATSLHKNSDVSFYNYGLISKRLKKPHQALENFNKAIHLKPNVAETFNNRGTVFSDLRQYELAIADFDKAIELNNLYAEAYTNKGKSLNRLKRYDEALVAYDKAISIKPDLAEAWLGRGNVFYDRKRYDEACVAYDKAISINPDMAEAWLGHGNVLTDRKRYDEAFAAYDRAISIKPDLPEAWLGRGNIFNHRKEHDNAILMYHRVQQIDPNFDFIKGRWIHQKMLCCEWSHFAQVAAEIETDVLSRKKSAEPFGWQGISNSERSLQLCAQVWNETRLFEPGRSPITANVKKTSKIRLGYVSGEFREQATSHLIVGVLENHNKSQFELFAFDNGWDDGSPIRNRINNTMHKVIDIRHFDDPAAAGRIANEEIDILINLNGYFGEERTSLFAYKCAPIQVNYLGFPGTLGAACFDYIIADRIVLPVASREFYDEKVVHLPDSYQPNDRHKIVGEGPKSRAEVGLPVEGFVFCCFNNNYKILPETFDGWMRIVKSVEGSVLWLIEDNTIASKNLRKEAKSRGIDPGRLIFAPRIQLDEHLARHRLADLFIDTLPYNAHTTASDALWAGLPVLTRIGDTFAGRVAASLLSTIGLSELITYSREEYEALAVELALNPQKMKAVRDKLAQNRLTKPLFDTPQYTKRLESAYQAMYQRYQAGLPPDHIEIHAENSACE